MNADVGAPLCSMTAFGSQRLIHAAVHNALTFLHCALIVVHLSRGTKASNATLALPQVVLNPLAFEYKRHGPNVLNAHLSNLQLLLEHTEHESNDQTRIVLLPGQAVFTRDCSPDLRAADVSLPAQLDVDLRRSPSYGWFRGVFDRLLRDRHDGPMRAMPLAVMPHEGSHYPRWLMRRILPLAFETRLRKDCPFVICSIEELTLPSLAAQWLLETRRASDFTLRMSDPLVERVFEWGMNATAFLAMPLKPCGRKLVHDTIREDHSLRALQLVASAS